LVFAEASKLSGNSRTITEDVFQAGVFGLIRAISTFFRERQTYFSGYARWWVRQAILLALKEEVSFFKIPSAIWHVYNKMERGEKIEENNEKIRQYVNVIKLVPIDQPVQQDGGTARLLDTLVDAGQEEAAQEVELGLAVGKMLEKLDPTTEKYLCLNFGIISHLQTTTDLPESDILKEQLRQTLALMRFHTTIE
jgi:RNA polymerase sigma factor (sigma-70 family)